MKPMANENRRRTMIKTTSFASPRSGHASSPSSKVVARSNAIKAAKSRAQSQPMLTGLFASPETPPEISASQARELIQSAAPKSKNKAVTSTQAIASPSPASGEVASASPKKTTRRASEKGENESSSLFEVPSAPVVESVEVAPLKAEVPVQKSKAVRAKTKVISPESEVVSEKVAPVEVVQPPVVIASIEVATEEIAPVVVAPQPLATPKAPAKKAKRARVPANLVEQYGQNLSKRVESGVEIPPVEDESPKKRLNRAERQARRDLMNPDDDLRARLLRAQSVIPTRKVEKRPPGWRFDCGRCGKTSYFQTTGAICNCGALALKD